MSSPPIDLNANRGNAMLAILWVETTVAILVVGLRMWGRLLIRKIGIDDWAMVFALVSFPT